MPIRSADYQARFTWQLSESGAPIADVCLIGGIPYVTVCPLCSCYHEIRGPVADGQAITPRCLLREFAAGGRVVGQHTGWITMLRDWQTEHPDAAAHDQIHVRMTTLAEMNKRPALKVIASKRTRKPRSKAA
jgi:hypothetical protein